MEETYELNDRTYIKPEVSRDEQLGFVDKLREMQSQDIQKIATDTHNLGTDVPSNLGGLGGAEGTWQQQYVNPQMNSLVADLRSTAQASALSSALSNLQEQYKQAYNAAYRAARKRSNTSKSPTTSNDGDVDYNPNADKKTLGEGTGFAGSEKTPEQQFGDIFGDMSDALDKWKDSILAPGGYGYVR